MTLTLKTERHKHVTLLKRLLSSERYWGGPRSQKLWEVGVDVCFCFLVCFRGGGGVSNSVTRSWGGGGGGGGMEVGEEGEYIPIATLSPPE